MDEQAMQPTASVTSGPARIQVTFPVLNEEDQLEYSIERTVAFCEANNVSLHEICIADNGSTDRTPEIGRTLAERHRNVTYLRVERRGFGLALKTAWERSDANFVGYMDVDLATDLRHLKEVHDLVARRAGYDLYLGARLLPDRKSTRLNSSHVRISYAVFCLKKKNQPQIHFFFIKKKKKNKIK